MEGVVDTLLVDEAGQVSLADTLAVGTCAQNLILLGDPQQLAQVAQGGHPEKTAVSSLGHVLGDARTMPAERGLFIDVSRRMHPDVCRFVSEISYGGELTSLDECARQGVTSSGLSGAGLRTFLVEHAGNRRDAREEADVIAEQIALLEGGTVTASDGSSQPIRDAGVMVVTPVQRPGAAAAPAAAGLGRRRHRRQVPGPRGRGRVLLDGDLERRGHAAKRRLPLLPQPAERGGVAGKVPGGARGQPGAAHDQVPDGGADAAGERAVSVCGAEQISSRRGQLWRLARRLWYVRTLLTRPGLASDT